MHSLSCASDQPVLLSQCFSDCCLTHLTYEFILLLTGFTGERFCAVTVFARRLNRRGALCAHRFNRCSQVCLSSLWTTAPTLAFNFVGLSGALSSYCCRLYDVGLTDEFKSILVGSTGVYIPCCFPLSRWHSFSDPFSFVPRIVLCLCRSSIATLHFT